MYVVYAVVHDARSVCSNESMEWLKRNWQECCFCARCGSLYVCWELTGESECSFAACFTSSVLLLLFVKVFKKVTWYLVVKNSKPLAIRYLAKIKGGLR